MAGIIIDQKTCIECGACVSACPFNALSMDSSKVEVNANCKMCRICVKTCPTSAISVEEKKVEAINKDEYKNILVYVEHDEKRIHPVTFELIGKGLQLASVIKQNVVCLLIGGDLQKKAQTLLEYGVAEVYVYDHPELVNFRVDNYANVFENCIKQFKPTVCLVGATTTGRSLAPRVATRFKTGLTADCTQLEMRENTDLVQIRPAFGGNIMAQIINTNCRPQFATVRYKVMDHAKKVEAPNGKIINCTLEENLLKSKIEILEINKKPELKSITDADVLVVAGAGIKDEKGMAMVKELADLLHGMVAGTRPLVEKGLISVHEQIGLSGRTVKPKLIITCGVSGAIQFVAGMDSSEMIIAINQDAEAPIFNVAHYAVIDDIYEVLPRMIERIKGGQMHV